MSALDDILAADRAHLWHPYTPMDAWRTHHAPLLVKGASGPYLELWDGHRLLDGNSSWWVSTLGHQHPRLVKALQTQAAQLCHVSLGGITHEPAALLAKELAAVAPPGLDQVFFSDDGSTAIEAAVKMAAQYQQQTGGRARHTFLALGDGFHGETVGATSLGGVEVFRRPFAELLFQTVHLTPPREQSELPAALTALENLRDRRGDTLVAVVAEPLLQGAAGMCLYLAEYLQALRRLCDATGALLIADEVFTGYGRLGTMWGCQRAGVVPNLLCTAKGFTAGMLPMAATLTSEKVLSAFGGGRERAFLYGHSYSGNPLGAAVAREVLAIYREDGILEGIPARAGRLQRGFEALAKDPICQRLIRSTRFIGAVAAAELRAIPTEISTVPTVETVDDLAGYTGQIGWRVYEEALKRGAYLRPLGNVIYVAPPVNIPLADLDCLLAIVHDSVRAVALATA